MAFKGESMDGERIINVSHPFLREFLNRRVIHSQILFFLRTVTTGTNVRCCVLVAYNIHSLKGNLVAFANARVWMFILIVPITNYSANVSQKTLTFTAIFPPSFDTVCLVGLDIGHSEQPSVWKTIIPVYTDVLFNLPKSCIFERKRWSS